MRFKVPWRMGVPLLLAAVCAAMLAVTPGRSLGSDGAACIASGGPAGNCCACSNNNCMAVQHQGVRKCDGSWCSSDECEWVEVE